MIITKMVDMAVPAKSLEEKYKGPMPSDTGTPLYPYGLCLSLDEDVLAKLDLDQNCEVGDLIHLFAMAKVTSVSMRDTQEGKSCRIELQITHLGLEDEDEENTDDEASE